MTVIQAWRFATAWPRGFIGWVHRAICALTTEEGRKGWAMLAALGCCFVMTGEVVFVLWVDTNLWHRFLIGASAQVVNLIVVTGLMVLLGVKRRTGGEITLPGGSKVSLAIDDSGAPVVITSQPVAPAPAAPPPPPPPAAGSPAL